ncbi:B-cell receptor CD22-like isoform X2 [Trachinotus anak]|uniref:B-cell receptor CD22-like isoform X2 n=1 Tax=Trachinotus anak TaxID=443729 RepID=UPI0039F236EF
MVFTAVASGFVVFVLSVVQGQSDWRVTYTSTQICAFIGSTVEIHCTYSYPSRINGNVTAVEKTFWFIKLQNNEPVDLRADSEYSGRVQYHCGQNACTLRISHLRESDSAEYKFRFITNQPGGKYIGEPGVTLSVTGVQVQVNHLRGCHVGDCKKSNLQCHSSCPLSGDPSYIWYKNEQNIQKDTASFSDFFNREDSISCAVNGHEDFPSPTVCVYDNTCNRVAYTDRRICAFKGSSVDISCSYNSYESITTKLWFRPDRNDQWPYPRPVDQYSGRIQVLETEEGRSTLRITDLTESDAAEYRFKFKTKGFEWGISSPGTTLTVTDPDLQVQVIWSSAGPRLICHSSCILSGRSSFVWYKNEKEIPGETSPSLIGHIDPEDSYFCSYEGHRSLPVYAPKVVSLLMSHSGDIMKGSSVNVTCSSDANPLAMYTWYKNNQLLLSGEPQLVFRSIQSSDSGEYYCAAENELGKTASKHVSIDVKYGPQTSSLSVSPTGEIVEGSSVNLTCSSDANPAANYTWYKENQTLLQGPEGLYHFTSISSKDRGIYHCRSENQYGQIDSTSQLLNVQYPPKLPSVSVSPSGEIVEGSSVTLTCSSDANPAANYTWYKENEDSPKASGQTFTITNITTEHSGNYYCEAQNTRGRHNSTLNLTVVTAAWKSAAAGTITAVLLALIVLAVFLWIRRDKCFTQQCERGERPDNRAQLNEGPVYDTPSAAAQRQAAEQQDDLQYATISFSPNHTDAVYSNVRVRPQRETEADEEEDRVEYTAVRLNDGSSAERTRRQEDGEDSLAVYSTVNKTSK